MRRAADLLRNWGEGWWEVFRWPAAGGVFRSLAGNQALARVVGGYVLFTLTQYSVWVAMLVYAYRQGGAAVAGLVAVAQLVPAAVLAPLATALADRRSPVFSAGRRVSGAGRRGWRRRPRR